MVNLAERNQGLTILLLYFHGFKRNLDLAVLGVQMILMSPPIFPAFPLTAEGF
jgi:hypothetical protein